MIYAFIVIAILIFGFVVYLSVFSGENNTESDSCDIVCTPISTKIPSEPTEIVLSNKYPPSLENVSEKKVVSVKKTTKKKKVSSKTK